MPALFNVNRPIPRALFITRDWVRARVEARIRAKVRARVRAWVRARVRAC